VSPQPDLKADAESWLAFLDAFVKTCLSKQALRVENEVCLLLTTLNYIFKI
jgi:hypothetical protein